MTRADSEKQGEEEGARRIWFEADPVQARIAPTGIIALLGIEIVQAGPDWVRGRMPVDHRTHQPFGLLHGGASVVLAETLASIGAACAVDGRHFSCVGLEINANHLRGVRSGHVTGTAQALHVGRSTQVWEIRIVDDDARLVCISRCTVAVVARKP